MKNKKFNLLLLTSLSSILLSSCALGFGPKLDDSSLSENSEVTTEPNSESSDNNSSNTSKRPGGNSSKEEEESSSVKGGDDNISSSEDDTSYTSSSSESSSIDDVDTSEEVDPGFVIPTGLEATYGDTLSSVELPSTWTWNDPSASVGNVGTNSFLATYTPSDTKYQTKEESLEVTVNKAMPIYEIPTGLEATYGSTLSSVILPSNWSWKNPTSNVGEIGERQHKAIYVPTDSNYLVVEETLTITVTGSDPSPDPSPDPTPDPTEVDPPATEPINHYDGSSSYSVMDGWDYGGSSNLSKTKYSDNTYVISWNSSKLNEEWAFVDAKVDSQNHNLKNSSINRVSFTVNGTAGSKILFKAQDTNNNTINVEKWVNSLGSGDQTINLNISSIINNSSFSGNLQLLIFPWGGEGTGSTIFTNGNITLKDVVLNYNPAADGVNRLNYSGVYLDFIDEGTTNAPGSFDVTDHTQTYTFNNLNPGYSQYLAWNFENNNSYTVGEYLVFTFTISSTVDTECVFKPYDYGAFERRLYLSANTPQNVTISIEATEKNKSDINTRYNDGHKTILFPYGKDNGNPISGTITITDLQLTRPKVNVGSSGQVRLVDSVTNNDAQYTFTHDASGNLVFTFNKANLGYDSFQILTNLDDSNYKHLTGTVVATENTHMIFKNGDGGSELRLLALKDQNTTIDLTFNSGINTIDGKIVMMVGTGEEGTTAKNATVTFKDFYLSKA